MSICLSDGHFCFTARVRIRGGQRRQGCEMVFWFMWTFCWVVFSESCEPPILLRRHLAFKPMQHPQEQCTVTASPIGHQKKICNLLKRASERTLPAPARFVDAGGFVSSLSVSLVRESGVPLEDPI